MCEILAMTPRPMPELLAVLPTRAELHLPEEIDDAHYFGELLPARMLAKKLGDDPFSDLIQRLEQATGGCPACMLAALRQKRIPVGLTGWDYKEARNEWWADINASRATA